MTAQRRLHQGHIILILLAAAGLYLIGNATVSLWDRDEPRYAQTSRQMLQSGDWVVPRLLEQVRTAKPIFIYWCQAAAMKLLGDTAFAARLPSVVGMLLTLIILATVLWRTIGPLRAKLTVLVMASAGLSIAAAKMGLTDAVLLVFITTAQLCLCSIYVRGSRSLPVALVMWVAVGFAVLTKGPVVLGVMAMTMIVLAIFDWNTRRIGWWRATAPIAGIVIVALICLPWAYLIHQREPTFFAMVLGHDVLNRITSGLEGHKGPPGYYLLTIWATFMPWSLLLPAALISGWNRRHLPQIRFAMAAIIGPWVMFEIVQTKLPHYLLPVFPALAFLTADMLIRAWRGRWFVDRGFGVIVLVWGIIVFIVSLTPALALLAFENHPKPSLAAMVILPILAAVYAGKVYGAFRGGRPLRAAGVMGVGMMILIGLLYGLYFPNAPYLRISQQVADTLIAQGATHRGDAIMIDYKEDSLAYYQGGTIRRERDNDYLAKALVSDLPRFVVMTREIWKQMPPKVCDDYYILSETPGLNYADEARIVNVLVLRKRAARADTTRAVD